MLAQSFKSADELGITEPQFDALRKTLVLLETGKLVHQPMPAKYEYFAKSFTGLFNMGAWSRQADCGTVACIGGTAELIGGVTFPRDKSAALEELFYPNQNLEGRVYDYESITPAQASIALRSFLTTGNARWDLALS